MTNFNKFIPTLRVTLHMRKILTHSIYFQFTEEILKSFSQRDGLSVYDLKTTMEFILNKFIEYHISQNIYIDLGNKIRNNNLSLC